MDFTSPEQNKIGLLTAYFENDNKEPTFLMLQSLLRLTIIICLIYLWVLYPIPFIFVKNLLSVLDKYSLLQIIAIAAPSDIPELLAAVTVPSSLKTVLRIKINRFPNYHKLCLVAVERLTKQTILAKFHKVYLKGTFRPGLNV